MRTDPLKKRLRMIGGLGGILALGVFLAGCDLFPPIGPVLPPNEAPTGLRASLAEFEDEIRITWNPVERATSYRVFRADTQDGDYQLLGTEPTLAHIDRVGAGNRGRLYWYKVEACNGAGCGPRSEAVAGYAGYPPAPTNVRASTTYGDRIVVTWDPVPGATYYQVFRDRHPDGTFPTHVGNSTGNQIADTAASPGLTYWYKVRACREVPGDTKCSLLSDPASGCRAPCLPPASEEEPI